MKNSRSDRLAQRPRFSAMAWLLMVGMSVTFVGSMKAQSQGATQGQEQGPSQEQATAGQFQAQPTEQADSLAEAARKAKEKKAKGDPAKVYTEEEMSNLPSRGVSVVGEGNSGRGSSIGGLHSDARSSGNNTAQSGKNEEAFWRGRARQLLEQMSATDQQIDKLKEEIRKYGNGGFDPSTGLGKNVIYVDDRQSQLKQLEKRRGDLDKQMDQLQEEGRKAGVPSSWFR